MKLLHGDCLKVLKDLPANYCDAMVTDPPAGIAFMGKSWDEDKGGRNHWIFWLKQVMTEALRVLKPGAHGLVWALPRTSHWTAMALENAGFEVRDVIVHVYGQGFPKSLAIDKEIDAYFGATPEVVGVRKESGPDFSDEQFTSQGSMMQTHTKAPRKQIPITRPSHRRAKEWEGWGTALKPASEHWVLIRKPLLEDNVAKNTLKHRTGGINIKGSRIGDEKRFNAPATAKKDTFNCSFDSEYQGSEVEGRWPSNFVLSHAPECTEKECIEGCPVKEIGEPSKFFYCPKISSTEKNAGLEDMPIKQSTGGGGLTNVGDKFGSIKAPAQNHHPTVKPTKLMTYLIKMVTPPGGSVLDPFMGSGSTGVAAKAAGFRFVGIEKEKEYFEIAKKRIDVFYK